jgi:hypothetical protein
MGPTCYDYILFYRMRFKNLDSTFNENISANNDPIFIILFLNDTLIQNKMMVADFFYRNKVGLRQVSPKCMNPEISPRGFATSTHICSNIGLFCTYF